jgi:hypothetical protein
VTNRRGTGWVRLVLPSLLTELNTKGRCSNLPVAGQMIPVGNDAVAAARFSERPWTLGYFVSSVSNAAKSSRCCLMIP